MHFIRYATPGGSPHWGVQNGSTVYALADQPPGEPSLRDFANPNYCRAIKRAVRTDALTAMPEGVRALAPAPRPGQFIGVGLNYRDHAEEQDADIPTRPLFFAKAPTSVTNPGDPIIIPEDVEQVDYEAELGVVIGRRARSVNQDNAWDHIAGYTVVNDVSARDAQFEDRQWYRGKSYDTFGPIGPTLVPRGAIDPHALGIRLRVNGETRQDSNTTQLIFGVDELIVAASRVMTLHPGDVIATGTPGGVGVFRDPPALLEPGDTVEAEIDGIGVLENPVRKPPTASG